MFIETEVFNWAVFFPVYVTRYLHLEEIPKNMLGIYIKLQ